MEEKTHDFGKNGEVSCVCTKPLKWEPDSWENEYKKYAAKASTDDSADMITIAVEATRAGDTRLV